MGRFQLWECFPHSNQLACVYSAEYTSLYYQYPQRIDPIVGHLIPAGTGLKKYRATVVGSQEEYEKMQETMAADVE